MKVLSKVVNIENEKFALVSDIAPDGRTYYGTISYSDMDSDYILKRTLDGFDMCISFESAEDAIKERGKNMKLLKYVAEKAEEGMSREEAVLSFYVNRVGDI